MDRGDRRQGRIGRWKRRVRGKEDEGLDADLNEDGRCLKERFDHVFMLFMLLFYSHKVFIVTFSKRKVGCMYPCCIPL